MSNQGHLSMMKIYTTGPQDVVPNTKEESEMKYTESKHLSAKGQ